MSWCGGRTRCKIYRDKTYCRKDSHAENGAPCDCRHARYMCEVGECELYKDNGFGCCSPAKLQEILGREGGRDNGDM